MDQDVGGERCHHRANVRLQGRLGHRQRVDDATFPGIHPGLAYKVEDVRIATSAIQDEARFKAGVDHDHAHWFGERTR